MTDRYAAFAHLTFNRPEDGILEVVPGGPNLKAGLVVALLADVALAARSATIVDGHTDSA